MASDAIGSISKIVREEISYVKKEVEPEVDGIFSKMYESTNGVSTGIGRSWSVIHTFSTGVAGAFKNVPAAGPATVDHAQSFMWSNPTTRLFPTLTEQVSPGYVQKTLTLVEGMGTFALPFHYFQADEIDASTADAVALTIRGTAKNVAQTDANSFYQNDNLKKALAEIVVATTGSVGDLSSPTTMTWTFANGDIEGRIGRFLPGMLVDVIDDSTDTHFVGGDGWIITKVDYVGKAVTMTHGDGSTAITGTIAAGDYLIPSGSTKASGTTTGPSGAETWLVDSGSPFGISLTTHPQFKSLVSAVNAVMDEAVLNKFVGGFFDAYGGVNGLDSLITTTGVLTAYMESIDGLYRYDRNNERLTLREGWASMDYAWQGRVFEILASRYQKPGQAYIMKLRDQNLKRYVPPSVSGVGKRGEFSREIQFVAPWMGSRTIFKPAHVSSATSEFAEAPFLCFREWCPDQLPGIKLTGLTELNP